MGIEGIAHGKENAPDSRKGSGNKKDDGDQQIHVHSHEPGGPQVIGRRTNGEAPPGFRQKELQGAEENNCGHKGEEVKGTGGCHSHEVDRSRGNDRRKSPEAASRHDDENVFDDDTHAQGGNEKVQRDIGPFTDGTVGEPFGENGGKTCTRKGKGPGHPDSRSESVEHAVANVASDNEKTAVSEIGK
jgi:hypothetical protein